MASFGGSGFSPGPVPSPIIATYDIAGAYAGAVGTSHTIGTLPAGAVITDAWLNVTSVFTPVNGTALEIAVGLGTTTTFNAMGGHAILNLAPIQMIADGYGGNYNINTTLQALPLKDLTFGTGLVMQAPVRKLPAQENVLLWVADMDASNDGGLSACGATLYIQYITM